MTRKQIIILAAVIFLLSSCTVQEDLLTPNCNDAVVTRYEAPWIYAKTSCGDNIRIKNYIDSITPEPGDWLIMDDEFRYY